MVSMISSMVLIVLYIVLLLILVIFTCKTIRTIDKIQGFDVPNAVAANMLIKLHNTGMRSGDNSFSTYPNISLNENNVLIVPNAASSGAHSSADACKSWCTNYTSSLSGANKCLGVSYDGSCRGTTSSPIDTGYSFNSGANTFWSNTIAPPPTVPILFRPVPNIDILVDATTNNITSPTAGVSIQGNSILYTIEATQSTGTPNVSLDGSTIKLGMGITQISGNAWSIRATLPDSIINDMHDAYSILNGSASANQRQTLQKYQSANTFGNQITISNANVKTPLIYNYSVMFNINKASNTDNTGVPYAQLRGASGNDYFITSDQSVVTQDMREARGLLVGKGAKAQPCWNDNYKDCDDWVYGPTNLKFTDRLANQMKSIKIQKNDTGNGPSSRITGDVAEAVAVAGADTQAMFAW